MLQTYPKEFDKRPNLGMCDQKPHSVFGGIANGMPKDVAFLSVPRASSRDAKRSVGKVRKLLERFNDYRPKQVIVLTSGNTFSLNGPALLSCHRDVSQHSTPQVTLASMAIPVSFSRFFPVLGVDDNDTVTDLVDRPTVPILAPNDNSRAIVMLGAYVFNFNWLRTAVFAEKTQILSDDDLLRQIIMGAIKQRVAHAYLQPTVLPQTVQWSSTSRPVRYN